MTVRTSLNLISGLVLMAFATVSWAQGPAKPAKATEEDPNIVALRDMAQKLPAVTEVLGNAIQVAQDCGLGITDMQGTQEAYTTILSSSAVINSFRTIGPDTKKLWPTEAQFKAAFKKGQQAAIDRGRPAAEVCAQVRLKFPPIDQHEAQSAKVLASRLNSLRDNDEHEANARISAGHSPLENP